VGGDGVITVHPNAAPDAARKLVSRYDIPRQSASFQPRIGFEFGFVFRAFSLVSRQKLGSFCKINFCSRRSPVANSAVMGRCLSLNKRKKFGYFTYSIERAYKPQTAHAAAKENKILRG